MKLKIVFFINFMIIIFKLSAQTFNPTIQVFGSPVLHFFNNIENAEISQEFNHSYGLLIGKAFYLNNSAIYIRTGYFIDTKKYEKIFFDTISWYPKSVSTQFIYGNIPVFLSYCVKTNNRISPFISVGYIFGNILNQKQSWVFNNGEQSEGFRSGIENIKNPKYMYGSMGVQYKASKNLSLFSEPYLKYCINSNSPYNYDNDSKLSFGLKIGLNYDFHK